ncbi:hypothetical protein ACFQZZ_24410 [Nocardia sp. GCM10030253]|uniref:hypothetical protein n=1 Tax=Nocardia sp. GCM10030253 TaxID=3273404 RepID=UPI0036271972
MIDKGLLTMLGWEPGTELRWRSHHGIVVIGGLGGSRLNITAGGDLRLPARLRRTIRVRAGDRVMLAADPNACLLFVLAPITVEEIVRHACAAAMDEVREQ